MELYKIVVHVKVLLNYKDGAKSSYSLPQKTARNNSSAVQPFSSVPCPQTTLD